MRRGLSFLNLRNLMKSFRMNIAKYPTLAQSNPNPNTFTPLEEYSKHRTVIPLYDLHPKISRDAFIAPTATVIGEVEICIRAQIWYNAVIRGDLNKIKIGNYVCIGDNTTVYTVASVGAGTSAAVSIAKNTIIGSHCSLCSCTIEQEVYIANGCTIMEGARIEKNAMLAPGSVVPPGRLIPASQLWGGNPVEYIKSVQYPDEFANYAYAKSFSELGSYNQDAYLHTPNAYLMKKATKEELEPSREFMIWSRGVDIDALAAKHFP